MSDPSPPAATVGPDGNYLVDADGERLSGRYHRIEPVPGRDTFLGKRGPYRYLLAPTGERIGPRGYTDVERVDLGYLAEWSGGVDVLDHDGDRLPSCEVVDGLREHLDDGDATTGTVAEAELPVREFARILRVVSGWDRSRVRYMGDDLPDDLEAFVYEDTVEADETRLEPETSIDDPRRPSMRARDDDGLELQLRAHVAVDTLRPFGVDPHEWTRYDDPNLVVEVPVDGSSLGEVWPAMVDPRPVEG